MTTTMTTEKAKIIIIETKEWIDSFNSSLEFDSKISFFKKKVRSVKLTNEKMASRNNLIIKSRIRYPIKRERDKKRRDRTINRPAQ